MVIHGLMSWKSFRRGWMVWPYWGINQTVWPNLWSWPALGRRRKLPVKYIGNLFTAISWLIFFNNNFSALNGVLFCIHVIIVAGILMNQRLDLTDAGVHLLKSHISCSQVISISPTVTLLPSISWISVELGHFSSCIFKKCKIILQMQWKDKTLNTL